jgi:ABC-type polysaccharide/polyol phosphate export permease
MVYNYLELLQQFISTDFKLRYKNSYLGVIWIILKPLAMFGIIYLIWSNIFKMDESYKMELLLGIIIMNTFNEAVLNGLTSLMSKAGVILKIKFPREIVVFSAVTISFIDFLFNMVVFAIFSIFTPIHVTFLGFLLFLLCILSIFLLTLGLGQFFSIVYIKLRDIHNLMIVILQLVFWMTPVYYTLDMLPENLQKYIRLNPLTLIVTYARKGLIEGNAVRQEDFLQIGVVLVICLGVFILGNMFFRKRVSKIAEDF